VVKSGQHAYNQAEMGCVDMDVAAAAAHLAAVMGMAVAEVVLAVGERAAMVAVAVVMGVAGAAARAVGLVGDCISHRCPGSAIADLAGPSQALPEAHKAHLSGGLGGGVGGGCGGGEGGGDGGGLGGGLHGARQPAVLVRRC
jgi:hypothetical protein